MFRATRQQAVTRANVNLDLCRHMASPGDNDLNIYVRSLMIGIGSIYGLLIDGTKPLFVPMLTLLQWNHNERDCVSNHQCLDCLFNRLSRRISRKTSKLRVTGLCEGNQPVTNGFPSQKASNAENVSIWWRHHVYLMHSIQIALHFSRDGLRWLYLMFKTPWDVSLQWRYLSFMKPRTNGLFVWSVACSSRHEKSLLLLTLCEGQ